MASRYSASVTAYVRPFSCRAGLSLAMYRSVRNILQSTQNDTARVIFLKWMISF